MFHWGNRSICCIHGSTLVMQALDSTSRRSLSRMPPTWSSEQRFQHVSTCVIQVSKWSLIAEQSGHLDPARVWYGDDMVMIWCKLILTHCDAVMTHCGPVVYQSLPNHCRAKWRARWLLGGRWNLTSPSEGREARFKWFTFELLKLWAKLQR